MTRALVTSHSQTSLLSDINKSTFNTDINNGRWSGYKCCLLHWMSLWCLLVMHEPADLLTHPLSYMYCKEVSNLLLCWSGECRKRKGLVDEEFRPSPSKQLITEETVAAQLGSLYLDQQSVSCDAHSRLIQDDLDTEMNSVVWVACPARSWHLPYLSLSS